jgi:hypothetical protein
MKSISIFILERKHFLLIIKPLLYFLEKCSTVEFYFSENGQMF